MVNRVWKCENPDSENLKHFQNPGHLSLIAPSIRCGIYHTPVNVTERHTTKILHKNRRPNKDIMILISSTYWPSFDLHDRAYSVITPKRKLIYKIITSKMSTTTKPISFNDIYFKQPTLTPICGNSTYKYLQNPIDNIKQMLNPYLENSAELPMDTLVSSSAPLTTRPFHLTNPTSDLSIKEC